MLKLALITLIFTLTACVKYPPAGQGGMAEDNYAPLLADDPDLAVTPNQLLKIEWQLAALHLDVLKQNGASLCFPATVVVAEKMQNRIIREIKGGLEFDAANDLIIQQTRLERLEKQLAAVQNGNACTASSNAIEANQTLAEKIYALVNSDNQFAFNSSAINPKYMAKLAEAAHLLRDKPYFRLHITGHADSIGDANTNQKLSLARAEQVQRYLTVFGVPAELLTIAAVSNNNPLFEGNEPQVRLVNRRVSIELIEQNINDQKTAMPTQDINAAQEQHHITNSAATTEKAQ